MQYPTISSVGIIPDGNRRWAKLNGIPLRDAYENAFGVLLDTVRNFIQLSSTDNFVIYFLSYDNLKRMSEDLAPVMEVESRMFSSKLIEFCKTHELRAIPVGLQNVESVDISQVDKQIVADFIDSTLLAEQSTKHYNSKTIFMLTGYSTQIELSKSFISNYNNNKTSFSIQDLEIPIRLDLVVRTSGEHRLSDFVPLQCGYAELFFPQKLFPDLTREDIEAIVIEYHHRKRSFGA